jgi:hypothetical protein
MQKTEQRRTTTNWILLSILKGINPIRNIAHPTIRITKMPIELETPSKHQKPVYIQKALVIRNINRRGSTEYET